MKSITNLCLIKLLVHDFVSAPSVSFSTQFLEAYFLGVKFAENFSLMLTFSQKENFLYGTRINYIVFTITTIENAITWASALSTPTREDRRTFSH